MAQQGRTVAYPSVALLALKMQLMQQAGRVEHKLTAAQMCRLAPALQNLSRAEQDPGQCAAVGPLVASGGACQPLLKVFRPSKTHRICRRASLWVSGGMSANQDFVAACKRGRPSTLQGGARSDAKQSSMRLQFL